MDIKSYHDAWHIPAIVIVVTALLLFVYYLGILHMIVRYLGTKALFINCGQVLLGIPATCIMLHTGTW